jgi:hypothetical protein
MPNSKKASQSQNRMSEIPTATPFAMELALQVEELSSLPL